MASSTLSSSQAIVKRSSDSALMPPPPPPKRIKRPAKVLDEDTYTDAISHIIARDYFPGLIEAELQQEYLDALESNDTEWITSASRKLTEVMTPGPEGRKLRGRRGTSMTPLSGSLGQGRETPKNWGGDTPFSVVSVTSTTATKTEKPKVDTNLSLTAFQSRYTSEDNESFYKLLDKQNSKKNEKYAWMWAGNKIPAARQIAYRRRQYRIAAAKVSEEYDSKLLALEDTDTRKATPDSWPLQPDNNLMFAPLSVEDSVQTIQQRAEETSRAAPKAVIYDNTRLSTTSVARDTKPAIPPSPSISAVQGALAGRPRPTASEPGFTGGETPRINGYSFVDSEPTPSPPVSGSSSWETTSSSLFGSGDLIPNPFKIKEKSRREALHHRMVDKVAKGKRIGKLEADFKTPVPKFASSPIFGKGGLTPAAQKLLGKVGSGKSPAGKGVWEGKTPKMIRSGLRASWTPRSKVSDKQG